MTDYGAERGGIQNCEPMSPQRAETISHTRQYPYPCIGTFGFLDLSVMASPHYKQIVDRVKGGEKLLDLGCCFGQEVRQLVSTRHATLLFPFRFLTASPRHTMARHLRICMVQIFAENSLTLVTTSSKIARHSNPPLLLPTHSIQNPL